VERLWKYKLEGITANKQFRSSKQFRNPDILGWLVRHCNIIEYGSEYPRELFDPFAFKENISTVTTTEKKRG
jgi:hypothetical protein